jgi:aspartate/tyrosine/aromatic aminotransferase
MLALIVTYYITIGGQTLIDRQPPMRQASAEQCAESVRAVLSQPAQVGVRVTAHCVAGSQP